MTSQFLYKVTLVIGYLIFNVQFWDSLPFAMIPTSCIALILLYFVFQYAKKESSSLYKGSFIVIGLTLFSSLSILFTVVPQVVELHHYLEDVIQVVMEDEKEIRVNKAILGLEKQERVMYIDYIGSSRKQLIYYLESKYWSEEELMITKYEMIDLDSDEIVKEPYVYYIYREKTIRRQLKEGNR